jgi:hypothetical protein
MVYFLESNLTVFFLDNGISKKEKRKKAVCTVSTLNTFKHNSWDNYSDVISES